MFEVTVKYGKRQERCKTPDRLGASFKIPLGVSRSPIIVSPAHASFTVLTKGRQDNGESGFHLVETGDGHGITKDDVKDEVYWISVFLALDASRMKWMAWDVVTD